MAKKKHPDEVRFAAEVQEMAAHQEPGPGSSPHAGEGKAKAKTSEPPKEDEEGAE